MRTMEAGPFRTIVCLMFAGLLLISRVEAGETWPEGLKDAAVAHFMTLQAKEWRIRDSTGRESLGIVPANVFDRATHRCHRASGQQYRLFESPVFIGQSDDGVFLVQATVQIYYRQAIDLPSLYDQPWKRGSDMVFQVGFEHTEGIWKPDKGRELIDGIGQGRTGSETL